MVTDKDREEIDMIVEGIGSFDSEFWTSEESDYDGEIISYPDDEVIEKRITVLIERTRAESAEQARKEAAYRLCKQCDLLKEETDDCCLYPDCCWQRRAILTPLQNVGNGEQVPTERNNKKEIQE